jgi:hypothetical protein
MPQADREIEAIRKLLLNWKRLSPGDISILYATLDKPDAMAATMEGSANFVLWTNLDRLGWSRRVRLPLPSLGVNEQPAFFVLTGRGRERLPAFLEHYELKPGTFYIDKKMPPPDPAWFDRALDSVAIDYVGGRNYRGFTREVAAKLRMLEMERVELAVAAAAYDAWKSVAELVDLDKAGQSEEAARVWEALRIRTQGSWAFERSGLAPPLPNLQEVGGRLGVGLGGELQAWLHGPVYSFAQAAAWLGQYGPGIEQLCAHIIARTKRAGSPSGHGGARAFG